MFGLEKDTIEVAGSRRKRVVYHVKNLVAGQEVAQRFWQTTLAQEVETTPLASRLQLYTLKSGDGTGSSGLWVLPSVIDYSAPE